MTTTKAGRQQDKELLATVNPSDLTIKRIQAAMHITDATEEELEKATFAGSHGVSRVKFRLVEWLTVGDPQSGPPLHWRCAEMLKCFRDEGKHYCVSNSARRVQERCLPFPGPDTRAVNLLMQSFNQALEGHPVEPLGTIELMRALDDINIPYKKKGK